MCYAGAKGDKEADGDITKTMSINYSTKECDESGDDKDDDAIKYNINYSEDMHHSFFTKT